MARFSSGRNGLPAAGLRRNARRDYSGWFFWLMAAVVVAGFIIIPQLISESVARNTAEGLGFTDVEVTKREWLFIQFTGCGEEDAVKFTVTGTNASGNEQTFYVCAGLFKGGTPRFP